MPRQPRVDAPGALHHVMGRGIEKAKVFRSDIDRSDFLDRLAMVCRKGSLIVYAWALLPSQFHLLLRTGREPLSRSMKQLLTGYVVNFNLRHKRHGHLFENRYKSIICEEDPYLLELTRYIHLNPLRAGMVKDLGELRRYPWAGHAVVMGKRKAEWQEVRSLLAYFGKRRREAVRKYEEFLDEGVSQGRRPELVGGGLIWSLGGWCQVISRRRKGDKVPSDQRILGSGEFVEELILEAEKKEKEKETLRLSRRVKGLEELMREMVKGGGIEEGRLRSGGRGKEVIRVRRMGYAGAEVARYLGVTTSAVNRLAASEESREVLKYA
jgi:putative transposase